MVRCHYFKEKYAELGAVEDDVPVCTNAHIDHQSYGTLHVATHTYVESQVRALCHI